MTGQFEPPVIDCGGAWLSVQHGEVATVLKLGGDIDAANAEQVIDEIRPYLRSEQPLVLDAGELGFLSVAGFRALLALDEERRAIGRHAAIVYGAAIAPYLRVMPDHPLPLVRSGVEALQRFGPVAQSPGPLPPVVPQSQVRC
ncbi:STAS domain-containing protein [Mycolicibacterium thermoresistibile]